MAAEYIKLGRSFYIRTYLGDTILAERLEQQIQAIMASSAVAPGGCWIARYLAKGRKGFYWYYKLQATDPIFPTKTNGKLSKYKHLGKAGTQAYLEALTRYSKS